jgi:hypothetical protein
MDLVLFTHKYVSLVYILVIVCLVSLRRIPLSRHLGENHDSQIRFSRYSSNLRQRQSFNNIAGIYLDPIRFDTSHFFQQYSRSRVHFETSQYLVPQHPRDYHIWSLQGVLMSVAILLYLIYFNLSRTLRNR